MLQDGGGTSVRAEVCPSSLEKDHVEEHVNPISPLRQGTANPTTTRGGRGEEGVNLFMETRVSLLFLGSGHVCDALAEPNR